MYLSIDLSVQSCAKWTTLYVTLNLHYLMRINTSYLL